MNEQTLYSEMLEIPVNTCNITYTESKKRRKRKTENLDNVKEMVLEKVNGEVPEEKETVNEEPLNQGSVTINKEKKKRQFPIIGVQIAVICLLLGVIIFSNLYMEKNGIAAFLNSVFSIEQSKTDEREYTSFNAELPVSGDVTVDGGVMCFAATGSVYAPCDGKITAITKDENNKYTVEITHSTKFKTVIKGIDYAYHDINATVYGNLPIGYSLGENVELCFYSGDSLITEYTVDGSSVVWEV